MANFRPPTHLLDFKIACKCVDSDENKKNENFQQTSFFSSLNLVHHYSRKVMIWWLLDYSQKSHVDVRGARKEFSKKLIITSLSSSDPPWLLLLTRENCSMGYVSVTFPELIVQLTYLDFVSLLIIM